MIKDLPISLIECVAEILSESDKQDTPCGDITHHRTKEHIPPKQVDESLSSWLNKGKKEWDEDYDYSSRTLSDAQGRAYYGEPDKHSDLAAQHARNLDQNHYNAVQNYVTGGLDLGDESGSSRVNHHLIESHRNGTKPNETFDFREDPDDDESHKILHLHHLDDALKQNKLDKQLTTYSGIGFNPRDILTDSGHLHLPAYTSSTTHKHVALKYAKSDENGDHHVLEIKHPKGSTGLYLGDNEDFTPFNQKEHLMPRGVTIKIDKEPEVHEDIDGNRIHVWKAKRLLSLEKTK